MSDAMAVSAYRDTMTFFRPNSCLLHPSYFFSLEWITFKTEL